MRSTGWRTVTGPDGAPSFYASARRALGSFLLLVGGVLVLLDVVSAEYAIDSIALGLVLSTGCVLLGLDASVRRLLDRD